jgi:hypothetical protein
MLYRIERRDRTPNAGYRPFTGWSDDGDGLLELLGRMARQYPKSVWVLVNNA